MTSEIHAYALRYEAEIHARQIVPLVEMTHARVLDEALSIVAANLARALSELSRLEAGQSPPDEVG